MKWIVCGGRDFNDVAKLRAELNRLYVKHGCELLVHGAARGADTLAGAWAASLFIPVKEYPADWANLGMKAGIVRNMKMLSVEKPDLVIAFPGGRGTAHMRRISDVAGVPVIRIA